MGILTFDDKGTARKVEWIDDGHKLTLDVTVSGGARRECLNCHKRFYHLVDDYLCVRCRIENAHAVPWDEIEATHHIRCPFASKGSGVAETLTPPACSTSVCGVAAMIGYDGLVDSLGHPDQRLRFEDLELPLFEPFAIAYVYEYSYYPGEYGGQGDCDEEFGWLPSSMVADFNPKR